MCYTCHKLLTTGVLMVECLRTVRLPVAVTTGRVRVDEKAQARSVEFEALFLQYYARVYGVLFRLVGDRAEAEDLTLETFWKLWQRPPARTEGSSLGGWLYRVATRLGYNALRASKRRSQHENAALVNVEEPNLPDPARQVERADERSQVRAVLRRMRDRDAQMLILRYSGLSYKEIAAATGVSPASVGTLLVRAEQEFERLFLEGGFDAPRR